MPRDGLRLPSHLHHRRLIAATPSQMPHPQARIDRRDRPQALRGSPKPRKTRNAHTAPPHCLAVDTVARLRDGLQCTFLTCVDPASAFGLAVALRGRAACHTQAALAVIRQLLPAKSKGVDSSQGLVKA